ncbi:unnamed protein product [Effrenium voratum]|uniref:Uncharacterized protein n=1 Tax=Effrenium voratum TaxID=2562239 RepID=A0AA36N7V2_9DINO|nr:unnamed protein product [Effrenium voratum]
MDREADASASSGERSGGETAASPEAFAVPPSPSADGGDLANFLDEGEWPEAKVAQTEVRRASAPAAVWAQGCASQRRPEAASPSQARGEPAASSGYAGPSSSRQEERCSPPGLRRFIADLSSQLAEEVKRRLVEEDELERRAAEKTRLLEELEQVRRRKEKLTFEQRADEEAASEIEKQHSELAEEHRALRQEVARQEEELEQLREEAKARSGQGRDWARDGPEKDALVETKLRIAQAHDELAQLRQQLWLNREGLKKKLADLQAENMRLKTGKSPLH